MSSGVQHIKFSLLSLTQLLAFGIFSIRLKEKGQKLSIFTGIPSPLTPTLSSWGCAQCMGKYTVLRFGGEGATYLSLVPPKMLLQCPSSLFVWPHQVQMAPWLMIGAQEFFVKVVSSLTLLDVCPAPSPLWGLPLWGFATILEPCQDVLLSLIPAPLLYLSFIPAALSHPQEELLCSRGAILHYISSGHFVAISVPNVGKSYWVLSCFARPLSPL